MKLLCLAESLTDGVSSASQSILACVTKGVVWYQHQIVGHDSIFFYFVYYLPLISFRLVLNTCS